MLRGVKSPKSSLEPSYTYSFINGHEQSLGIGVGLLIAIR